MDFLQIQQDGLFSLYTRQQSRILLKELGSLSQMSLIFSCNLKPCLPLVISDAAGHEVHLMYLIVCFSSSRVASRGIMLADSLSDEFYRENASGGTSSQSSVTMEIQPSSTPGSGSYFRRLRAKVNRLWLQTVRCWPSVLLLSS